MAFIAANTHVLARELWPQGIGKLQQDKHLDLLSLPASRVVPRDGDDLLEWLFVQLQDRGKRGLVFMHPSVEGAKGSPQVVVHLQGIIEDMNLGLYGDWDQTEANAKKAMQKLTLGSGGCREAFVPQVKALDDIRQTVSMMAGVCPKRLGAQGNICLRRRVFTKVNVGTAASIVTENEDPSGTLDAVADKWRITSRIKCGTEHKGGGIQSLNVLSLRPSDMVDVSVTVVAVISDGPMGKRCEVIFEPKTIVRLACADAVKERFQEAAREVAGSRRRPASSSAAMEEGYSFEEKRRKTRKVAVNEKRVKAVSSTADEWDTAMEGGSEGRQPMGVSDSGEKSM
ncbi:hypothetical protein LXA43DRAFT_1102853 [Ganoderma leucocontextum]|nr:hypothetical protein LXA43DRAFT_1102853 [Ganoderma leucocontextum]